MADVPREKRISDKRPRLVRFQNAAPNQFPLRRMESRGIAERMTAAIEELVTLYLLAILKRILHTTLQRNLCTYRTIFLDE